MFSSPGNNKSSPKPQIEIESPKNGENNNNKHNKLENLFNDIKKQIKTEDLIFFNLDDSTLLNLESVCKIIKK